MKLKKLKKAGALILTFALTVGGIQFPDTEVEAAQKENLALSAEITASNTESVSNAANAIDGNKHTSWASNEITTATPVTMTLTWDEVQTMKGISILWERRTVQNLNIELSSDGTSWNSIFSRTTVSSALEEIINLDEIKSGTQLRLTMSNLLATDPDGITENWANASIFELEIYESALADIGGIAAGVTSPVINEETNKISMPETGEGATVRFCADYEQIIGEDGTVYQPLQTKTVKGFYEIKDVTRDASVKTSEYTVTVPGKYAEASGTNEKPAVIPELQEWYGKEGSFYAGSASRIIIGSDELKAAAEEFAADYKDIAGVKMKIISGSKTDAKLGDFYMTLTEGKGLGKEGYTIDIDDVTEIEAEDAVGVYWATRSVLQILKQTEGSIPKGLVRDYPKYKVRAFSLDVGRKPFTMDALYQFAKNMSWYKMNSFQIHLSDNLIFMEDYKNQQTGTEQEKLAKGLQAAKDQAYAGFRLESGVTNTDENYPELLGKSATSEDVYYTKDEFRQFVKDSRMIGIDIVPELDMPAHALPFTRVFPQYRTKTETGGQHTYTIDELNLDDPETTEFAKSIWEDYFTGDDPVFDQDTTIHIGTDEFHGSGGNESFRKFSDDMIKFVQDSGRNVRMWGSLSNKNGTTPVRSEKVQLNIWSTGYANPTNMYNQGFDMINTLVDGSTACGGLYIVPSGNRGRGAYGDFLQTENLYNNWQPNVFSGFTVKAGDDQMLGACFASWHDNIDTRANGISQYDSFYRFMDSLPVISAKVWGEVDKAETSFSEFCSLVSKTGTAPNTNMYANVDFATNTAADWTFDEAVEKDSSVNGFDLTAIENAEPVNGETTGKALQLNGGKSYAETPLNQVGSNAVIKMKVKMDADADDKSEQILCESKEKFGVYGTYAIKASITKNETSYVGFSREGYDYTFNYTLPQNEWVELEFHSGQDTVALYVNGTLVDDNPEFYFANHPETPLKDARGNAKVATMMVPIGRIGSDTDSFKGKIEYVTVTQTKEPTGDAADFDAAALKTTLENYADYEEGAYTDASWNVFANALEVAKLAAESNASNEECLYAKEQLEQAAAKLITKPADNRLSDAVKTAESLVENNYESEGWRQYQDALAQAKKVDANADETVKIQAAKALERAKAVLISKVPGKRQELSDKVKKMEDQLQNEDLYTPESIIACQNAIHEAKALLEQEDATFDALAEKLLDLERSAPVTKIDAKKAEIRTAVLEAEIKLRNESAYTKASVDLLKQVISDAKTVLAKNDVTLEELSSVLITLQNTKLVKDTSKPDSGLKDNDSFEADGMKYQVVNASALTAKLVKGKDTAKLTINTASYGGKTYKIVEIGEKAFNGCKKKLKKVTIGANVTAIGKNAFKGCKKLTNVIVQNNSKLNKIGGGAFKKTSSKIKIKLPKNLKKNKNLKKQLKKAGIKKGL